MRRNKSSVIESSVEFYRGQCGRVSDGFRESVPEGGSFGPESLVPPGSLLMVGVEKDD